MNLVFHAFFELFKKASKIHIVSELITKQTFSLWRIQWDEKQIKGKIACLLQKSLTLLATLTFFLLLISKIGVTLENSKGNSNFTRLLIRTKLTKESISKTNSSILSSYKNLVSLQLFSLVEHWFLPPNTIKKSQKRNGSVPKNDGTERIWVPWKLY